MKYLFRLEYPAGLEVAPRAGAGIEIGVPPACRSWALVAPRAGAGIEICPLVLALSVFTVAPRAGAGIEIIIWEYTHGLIMSPLAQGRELK